MIHLVLAVLALALAPSIGASQTYPSPRFSGLRVDTAPIFASCTGAIKGRGTTSVICGPIDVSSDTTGTIQVSRGGTGLTSCNGAIKGFGTSASCGPLTITSDTIGILPVNRGGTGLATCTGLVKGTGTAATCGAASLTTDVSGTLPAANGGLGAASLTGYIYCNGASPCTSATTIPPTAIAPTSYLGQVATKSYVPTQFTSANYVNGRSLHVATDDLTTKAVTVCYANWAVPYTSPGTNVPAGADHIETPTGTTVEMRVGVEYPVGSLTSSGPVQQLLFSGSVPGFAGSGATLCTDPKANLGIPKGAAFALRYWMHASGVVMPLTGFPPGNIQDAANGESLDQSATDTSGGGTLFNNYPGYNQYPVAILAQTTNTTFLITGDSRNYGTNDSVDDPSGRIGTTARSLVGYGYINVAVPGDSTHKMATNFTKRAGLASYTTTIVNNSGINDLGYGAPTMNADYATFWGLFPNKRVYQSTLDPYSTTKDACASSVNQAPSAYEGVRVSINNRIRRSPSPLTGFIEIADWMEIYRDSGIWNSNYAKIDVGAPPGTITTTTGSTTVTGSGTLFTATVVAGSPISTTGGTVIGTAASTPVSDTSLTLSANATVALTAQPYILPSYGLCLHAGRFGTTSAAKYVRPVPAYQ